MRRWWTWLVVTALAGIGVAATADTLRGGEETVTRAAESTATAAIQPRAVDLAVSRLREAGVTGVLTYSDEDCRLHAITLPGLETAHAPPFEMCAPYTGTGGIGAFDGDVVWSGLGYQAVQVVLSKEKLDRLLHRDDLAVRQAVSLGSQQYATLAGGNNGWVVSIHDGDKIVRVAGNAGEEDVVLRPSPRGGYLGVLLPRQSAVRVARPGRSRRAASGRHAPARHRLVARRALDGGRHASERLRLPDRRAPGGPLIRIPLAVRDLDWGSS